MTERFTIINRQGLKIAVEVDSVGTSKNLVFIAHGQAGFMKQRHILAAAGQFLKHGFRVVRFDATHSVGSSEGELFDVTYDSYIEDLEDVINWAGSKPWFKVPFGLCGHSMGAQSTAWYAEHYPKEVSLLVAMAPVINYDLFSKGFGEANIARYKKQGYNEWASGSRPGQMNRAGWGVVESLKKFDLLPLASQLTMPVIDIVGEYDEPCLPSSQKQLIAATNNPNAKLVIIKNANHNYRNHTTDQYEKEFDDVISAIDEWLASSAK